jgi:hypothetical protein
MEIYVLDENRALLGLIEAYDYFRWTRRYSRCGNFELKAVSNEINTGLLAVGRCIWKNDDAEIGMIEYLEYQQGTKEMIHVKGRFATALLARRIIWQNETLLGDLSICVGTLMDQNVISATDTGRRIPYITYSASSLNLPIALTTENENLLAWIEEQCDVADVGIRTLYDPIGHGLTVTLYKGTLSQAVFSKEFENITAQTYTDSVVRYANTALILGEDTTAAIINGTGDARREIFVNASREKPEDHPDSYESALQAQGMAALAEHPRIQNFDAQVSPYGNLTYRVDYDLGNMVTVISKRWGVTLQARITEVSEQYDASGMSLDVTFGKGLLTLAQALKGVM